MKRQKKSVAAKPIAMSLTAQAMIDLAMGLETGNKRAIRKATQDLSHIGVQIYIGEPVPEFAAQDIKLATIPQLVDELKRRTISLVLGGFNVVAAEEKWFTTIKGSPPCAVAAFNLLAGKLQQYKPESDGHEPTPARVQNL